MWNYKIIDNFLEQRHFDLLCSKVKNITDVKNQSWKRYVHQVSSEGKFLHSYGPITDDGKDLAPGILSEEETLDIFHAYNNKFLEILKELAPHKVASYKSSGISVVLTGKDKKYPAHTDVSTKILSTVVYIAPEKNRGTIIADNKELKNSQEIEWKQNRAFIFSSEKHPNPTWHGYSSDGVSSRLTLVWYMQNNLKDKRPAPGDTGTFVEQRKKGIKLDDY
jgi:hypothetical protein